MSVTKLAVKRQPMQRHLKTLRKMRSERGFTLIELLVVVIIIGILAAIALPNFIGAQDKAKEASVKGNMHTAQVACEASATDAGGAYPLAVDNSYKSYFPGGKSDGQNAAATGPVNPFTNASEFPTTGAIGGTVQAARVAAPGPTGGSMGQVVFAPIAGTSYAILGTKKDATAINGTAGGTLVLSNQ